MGLNGTNVSGESQGRSAAIKNAPGPRRMGGVGGPSTQSVGTGHRVDDARGLGRVAVVHDLEGERRILILDPVGGAGAGPSILHAERTEDVRANLGPASTLAATLTRHRAERIVRIAPAHECLARVESIPGGAAGEMRGAMDLLLEARLPPEIPPHRRAAGLLGRANSPAGERPVLLTAWTHPRSRPDASNDSPLNVGLEERWITPAAALAGLLAYSPRGESESGVATWADREHGSITVVSCGGSQTSITGGDVKPIARVLLDDASDPAWPATVDRVTRESSNLPGPRWASSQGSLRLSAEQAVLIGSGLGSHTRDPEWMDRFGLALGAALAATSPDPLARSLSTMLATKVETAEPWAVRKARWLAQPGRAKWVGIGVVAAAMLLPLSIAWGRAWWAEKRLADAAPVRQSLEQLEKQALLYQQLEKSRWPMSKLLADVSRAAPLNVRIEQVRLATDQGLTLIGTATDANELNQMQQQLTDTRIFRAVRSNRSEVGEDGRLAFELTAQVASPHSLVPKAEDFAARTLAQRLYNDDNASNLEYKPESGGSSTPSRREARGDRPTRRAEGEGRTSDATNGENSRRPNPADAAGPPKPLSDDDIAKLTREDILKEFPARRKYARSTPGIDPALKDRLEQEVTKLQERLKKLNAGGGS